MSDGLRPEYWESNLKLCRQQLRRLLYGGRPQIDPVALAQAEATLAAAILAQNAARDTRDAARLAWEKAFRSGRGTVRLQAARAKAEQAYTASCRAVDDIVTNGAGTLLNERDRLRAIERTEAVIRLREQQLGLEHQEQAR